MISYTQIEDVLMDNYTPMRVTKNGTIIGIRVHVASIVKHKHLTDIRGKLNGSADGLKIWYDNNREFVEIKINE